MHLAQGQMHAKCVCTPELYSGSCDQFTIPVASGDDLGVVEPHYSQISAMPAFSDFMNASLPLILTGDPRVQQVLRGSRDPAVQLPLNTPLSVEASVCTGQMLIRVKGAPGTSPEAFNGTKWLNKATLQVKFTRRIPADDLWVGQELLNKPLLPLSFQKLVFNTAAKFFSSTSKICYEGDSAGFLNPLLAMAQVINISRPGCEPDVRGHIQEDMRLLSSKLSDKRGNPMSSEQRQKYFDKPSNLAAIELDDTNVYTFVIGQSILDMPKYKLKLGGLLNLDLCPILNGQPLQMMCKSMRSNQPLVSVLLWHERLNYPEGCAARSLTRGSRHSRASSSCSSSNADSVTSSTDGDGSSCSILDGCIGILGNSSSSSCMSDAGCSSSLQCMGSLELATGSSDGDYDDVSSEYGSACSEWDADCCSSEEGGGEAVNYASTPIAYAASRLAARLRSIIMA